MKPELHSAEKVEPEVWQQLSDLIRERMGLHFTPERWGDLERGLRGAAPDFGFTSADGARQCARWLATSPLSPAQIDILARHLTIGETYFFRDPPVFAALREEILPEIIRRRRERGELALRFWSAACCSGEEAYSIAILLFQELPKLLPDWRQWNITVLGTDLNPYFLNKAQAGVFSKWSFRDAARDEQDRFFTPVAEGRFQIKPEIRRMVHFAQLNLISGNFPSSLNGTAAQDVIFCRNVLMYFNKDAARGVVEKLSHCLVEGGVLVPSASEASPALFTTLRQVQSPGAILYRKEARGAELHPPPRIMQKTKRASLPAPPEKKLILPPKIAKAQNGFTSPPESPPETPQIWHERARQMANDGKLNEALQWCEKAIAAEKMNARHHYLRASILMEQNGSVTEAETALRRAIYLEPDFALAHFALGNLARRRHDATAARRSLTIALRLLAQQEPNTLLPESDNLTAGHLAEVIAHTLDGLTAAHE